VCLHHLIHVVESESETGYSSLAVLLMDGSPPELVEYHLLFFFSDADAVIAYL
jgi:hypothetical protein